MRKQHRIYGLTILLALLTLTLGSFPARADDAFEPGWVLRFGGIAIGSGLDLETADSDGAHLRFSNDDDAVGAAVSVEYRFSQRLGVEAGLMAAADVDYGFSPFVDDTLAFNSVSAALNVHLTPGRPVDVYAGPLVAYVHYDDLRIRSGHVDPGTDHPWWPIWTPGSTVRVSIDDGFAFGAQLGLDVHFGDSRWMLCGALKYLSMSADGASSAGGRADVDFDPLIVGLAAGFRF